MVELRTRKREMKGYRGNRYEKLGHKRIPCERQFTIIDMAATSPDPGCHYLDMRSSKPNHPRCTPDFSYPLVITSFLSSSPISLFFSSTTLLSSRNTKFTHPSLSLLFMIMCWHRVQHTLSTSIHQVLVYNEYKHTPSTSIHRVQAYAEYSIHSGLFVFPSFP